MLKRAFFLYYYNNMKIGIFGGSFNPVTKGHTKCAKTAIKNLNLDKLIFLPTFINPNKTHIKKDNSQHRIKMLKLVLEGKMEISEYEINKKGISYTFESLRYFKNKYPNDELFFIFGSDNLETISKWENIDEIAEHSQIVIIKRQGFKKHKNLKKYKCLILEKETFDEYSSTDFLKSNFDFVEEKVRKYIFNNFLYMEEILKNSLSEKRYIHSINAAKKALEIAKANNYKNPIKAYNAALVHDIAKEYSKQKHLSLIKKYSDKKDIFEYEYHQEVGYIIFKFLFLSDDEEFNHSIRVHTSLDFNVSQLDIIVYLADKLCIGRKWEGIQKVRELSLIDLNKALKLTLKRTIDFNISKGIVFSEHQNKIHNKILNS